MEEEKRAREGRRTISWRLGSYEDAVKRTLALMREERIIGRIWAHDHTVWNPNPVEIKNRLGWLHSPGVMAGNIPQLMELADAVRADGYTHALLLGMGGSSLAPEVLGKIFVPQPGRPQLRVLDSTDPGAVLARAGQCDPSRSLFIVSTKSGTTLETLSLFKFFYNRVAGALGKGRAGERFIAITDPGSALADLAGQHGFRATFLNDPHIGGRYSALSCFGLVPVALMGIDLNVFLERANSMASDAESSAGDAATLGAALGELTLTGRDKMTLVTSPELASFGDWVEQLLAESTGKEGRGILPVVGEPLGPPEVYGNDRVFVHLRLAGDTENEAELADLARAGHPVITINLEDRYALGGQFFLWEMATAVAGWRMEINPFDQPDVESSKVLARRMMKEYQENQGISFDEKAALIDGEITVFGGASVQDFGSALATFVEQGMRDGAYVALQAYLQPNPETDQVLHGLRVRVRDRFKTAVTVGYGPRYLHSTGQLHKGDGGHGLFVQITADDAVDVSIPDNPGSPASSMTFGLLKKAQAAGDRRALEDAGRRVVRFHLGNDIAGGLIRLTDTLA